MALNDFIHRGGLWVLVQNVLMLAVFALGLMFREPAWHWSTLLVGSGLMLASAVFGVAGVFALGRNLSPTRSPATTGNSFRPASTRSSVIPFTAA